MRDLSRLVRADGCSPGAPRPLGIEEILVGRDAVSSLPTSCTKVVASGRAGPTRVAVLCDGNTRRVAGPLVEKSLAPVCAAPGFCELVSPAEDGGDLIPDERTIGMALTAAAPDADLLVSLGAGTITDVARYVAYRIGRPLVAVATAPSVDGFTSAVSSLLLQGVKTTIPAAAPLAVIADSSIMAAAPRRLIRAGIGDLVGKLISRLDWSLSGIVNDEKMCDYIIELVAGYVERILALEEGATSSLAGVETLFEGLAVSGLGMTLMGNSRPASGAEHHIAHLLDMQQALGNVPRLYHGECVAVGAYVMSILYHQLASRSLAEVAAARGTASRMEEERISVIRRQFGALADVLLRRLLASRHEPPSRSSIMRNLESGWERLQTLVRESLPGPSALSAALRRMKVPHDPRELGIPPEILRAALLCTRTISSRYTLLAFLDEIGLLEEEVASTIETLYAQ